MTRLDKIKRAERVIGYLQANEDVCKGLSIKFAELICETPLTEKDAILEIRSQADRLGISREVSDFIIKQGKICAMWYITGHGPGRLFLEIVFRKVATILWNFLSFITALLESLFTGHAKYEYNEDLHIGFETKSGLTKSLSTRLSDFFSFSPLE